MLYNFQKTKLCKHLLVGGALFAVGFGMNSCTDTYDLDSEQPSGLNSIYGYMEDKGNFQNYMRIIKDLGQEEILSKTGSKTLFLANDAAFEEFYQNNQWGVRSYEDLSLAQKKILLGSAMIDNPYTTSMLSTAQGPVRGEVCRRVTSQTLYDTVDVVPVSQLPTNSHWASLRAKGEDVVLFRDASAAPPVVHFTPKFLDMHKLLSSDIEFLYRLPEGSRVDDDVFVGNAKIINSNIFCKNGFIHEVDRVMLPLDNMAQLLLNDPKLSTFSELVERFAAPSDSVALTRAYNTNKGVEVDTVFVKRYFSKRSAGGGSFEEDKDGVVGEATLKFDPGWNTYIPSAFSNRNPLMEDMAVILAPTNEAMDKWWNGDGSGRIIRSYYGDNLDDVPNSVISELINNNFLEQITMSLPSKFAESVYDDANEIMGITTADIDSVAIGCNGVVYYTNKVFEPATYRSVFFPAVTNTNTMSIIRTAVEQLDYKPYLNSMVSEYSFFIPTNNGFLTYIDPVTYGKLNRQLWEFYYDAEDVEAERICVRVYDLADLVYDEATQSYITEGVTPKKTIRNANIKNGGTADAVQLRDRMEDILDNIIVIGKVEEGKKYYITKGRSFVKVNVSGSANGVPTVASVEGTWQEENNAPIPVKESTVHDNGYSYQLDGVVSGGSKSVVDVLAEVPECSEFFNMVANCATSPIVATGSATWVAASSADGRGNLISILGAGAVGNETGKKDKIAYLLNGYHYTIYAPDNAAMAKAYEMGLPSYEDLLAAEEFDAAQPDSITEIDGYQPKADSLRAVMLDFVKYHIQDNSIYVDKGFESGQYESAKIELALEPVLNAAGEPTGETAWVPRRPYKIDVAVDANGMTVTDKMGETHRVRTELSENGKPLYNMQAREYWLDNNGGTATSIEAATTINTVSSAVIHVIDGPLVYDKDNQFEYVAKPLSTSSVKSRR